VRQVSVRNKTRELRFPLTLIECSNFLSKFNGLMFQKNLTKYHGLVLSEKSVGRLSSSIHMFFMNFDIGVVWLDSKKCVVDTQLAIKWHPYYAPNAPAQYTLEIHPSRLNEFLIEDEIEFIDEI
jgi:uncharacterized membrane protein (UPF0127 family)